jgi:hypothetical protein
MRDFITRYNHNVKSSEESNEIIPHIEESGVGMDHYCIYHWTVSSFPEVKSEYQTVFSIYSVFQISTKVDIELVIIITISIIQTEFYNKTQRVISL